jgi:hypothetical protein
VDNRREECNKNIDDETKFLRGTAECNWISVQAASGEYKERDMFGF